MRNRVVRSCQECPFCNYDNEYGYDICNLNTLLFATGMNQMPENNPHTLCPLKEASVLVELKQNDLNG